MRFNLVVFFYGLLMLLTACGKQSIKENIEVESALLIDAGFKANAIHPVDNAWLVASETQGIQLLNPGGAFEKIVAGNFEFLDAEKIGNDLFIATFDLSMGKPIVFYKEQQKNIEDVTFNIDGLCLYQSPSQDMYLFLVDGYGGGEMRWVFDGGTGQMTNILVKNLHLPAGIESCVVDKNTQQVFFLEETLGVWAYPAEPEISAQRALVSYSPNRGDLKGLASAGDKIVVAENENASIAIYDKNNADQPLGVIHLAKDAEPADLALALGQSKTELAYIDENSGAAYVAELPFMASASTALKNAYYPQVPAVAETRAMDRRGDAADDPAIWVNHRALQQSRILGTNKKFGLLVYDLNGEQLQSLPVGNVNNVDIRQDILLAGKHWDIAAASNRSDQSLQLFSITAEGYVSEAAKVATGLDDVYGLCLYRYSAEKLFAFINDKDGRVQQYQISFIDKKLTGKLVAQIRVDSQPEGCVADDAGHQFFLGEEDVGVWHYRFDQDGLIIPDSAQLIVKVGKVLVDDVEGMALYIKENRRYLVVSSQGDNSYALFQADQPFAYIGSFRVGLNAESHLDGTSETDGLEVSSVPFNPQFSDGLVVIQDGNNLMPEAPQNFKLVSWAKIANALRIYEKSKKDI